MLCFNPCFRGSRPRTRPRRQRLCWRLMVSILVFVEVALGLDRPISALSFPAGFNPCFRGSRPRTSHIVSDKIWALMFQSLFSWKSPSDPNDPRRTMRIIMFQSLFSWKSPSDNIAKKLGIVVLEFQSLFSWKSPSDPPRVPQWRAGSCVSILVFVEVALGLSSS